MSTQQRRRNRQDHLEHIEHLAKQLTAYERTMRHAVQTARRHGASWQQIADCLGITRQSAWERFGST